MTSAQQRIFTAVLLVAGFAPVGLYSQNPVEVGLNAIKSEEIIQTIGYLSSSRFKGRLAGTAEYEQAARYVATRLKNAGAMPVGQPSMLWHFSDELNIVRRAQVFLMNKNGRAVHPFRLGRDFVCRGFTGAGLVKGEAVFVGFGVRTDEYNDYRSIDVKGKVAVAFKTAPPWSAKSGSWGDTSPRAKARIAKELGAKALILMGEPGQLPIIHGSVACGAGPHIPDFPMIQVGTGITDSIFAKLPVKPLGYYERIARDKAPHSIETDRWLMIDVETDYSPGTRTANVVAYIEGSDPKRKGEFVVLGAHLDHAGYQTESLFFPGANDNASGVATLIAIAEAIKKSNIRLKRSVVFLAFSSEESGMKGSKRFVDSAPIDLSKTVAMVNFDCVGYGDSIAIGGKTSYPRLWRKARRLDRKYTKLLSRKTFGGGGADAEAFHRAGISTLYFNATGGGHKHLHQTTDRAETINKELSEKVAQLGFLMTVKLANGRYKGERDRLRGRTAVNHPSGQE